MAEGSIWVEMFGCFSISYRGEQIMLWKTRGGKAVGLLQYLIYNKGQGFPKESIYGILYDEEQDTDPSNTFRVTLHRIRKLLVSSGLPERQYITCRNNICTWSADGDLKVDAHEFERTLKAAEAEADAGRREALLARAFEMYRGEFLPMSASDAWVAVESVRYKRLYVKCVADYTGLLAARGDGESMLDVYTRASQIYPYDEDFHIGRIRALIGLRRYGEALVKFEEVTGMFFEELGIKPSDAFAGIHSEISAHIPGEKETIEEIQGYLEADVNGDGAYYCNYLTFVDSYRFVMRIVERGGQSVYLMLCTLTDMEGSELSGKRLSEASEALHGAIKTSLRRGDLYTRYSPSRFLVLLIGINYENCSIVSERIARNFRQSFSGRGSRLKYKVVPASKFNSETRTEDFRSGGLKW